MSNLLKRWKATWNPDMYHGWGREKKYFEGWYFKIVDPTEQYVFAIIPGISMEEDGSKKAFIQVLDGKQCQASYHDFTANQFQPSGEQFAVQLGDHFFSADKLELNLTELKGRLHFKNRYPWPSMLGAPGIMGWYSFVPFMQCYHGVVSMGHRLEGTMEVNGKSIDFTGGKGYLEKDWGESFPSSWIWMQTNHFAENDSVSLMASVARIPWLTGHFVGYIVGFLIDGKLLRFATYTGAMMQAVLEEQQVRLAFKDRQYRLEIIAHQAAGANLVSPISGQMTGKVNESMQATVEVRLFEKGELVFSGTGRNAGLEVAGLVGELLTDKWRR